MIIQQSSNRLLNEANRCLLKAEDLFVQGKYMRAERDLVRSIAILSRVLENLKREKKSNKRCRTIPGRDKYG